MILFYTTQNLLIEFVKKLLFRKQSTPILNIIIFRTGSIGDSICAIPAIQSIRNQYPSARVTLLTNSGKSESMAIYNLIDSSLYDDYIDYSNISIKELYKIISSKKIDLFIEFPQPFASLITNIRNMLFVKFSGVKYGFGWEVYANTICKKRQNKANHFRNESVRLLDIIEKNGINRGVITFQLNTMFISDKITKMIISKGLSVRNKNIAMVIGAKRETNRWPIDFFLEVKNNLISLGFNVFIIGGKEDSSLAKVLLGVNVYDFTGQFTPIESAEILKHCLFTISNDTGPLHLSYAVKTPVIGIYSNRDYPKQWFPPANITNYVFRSNNIKCTICLREKCPFDNMCLRVIKPQLVIDKAIEFINTLS